MKKLKKLELKSTPKMQDLQSEEMKHFQGGMGTWDEESGSYMLDEVTVYGGENILPYVNMVYVNSHDNQVSGVIEATLNAVGMVWNGFAWVYNRVAN